MPDKDWTKEYSFKLESVTPMHWGDHDTMPFPQTADGFAIRPHGNYYAQDGRRWHICAVNTHHVYGYDADKPEPSVTDGGQKLKRLKPEWLTVEPQQSLSDCMTSMKDSVCKLMEELAKLEAKLGGEVQRER